MSQIKLKHSGGNGVIIAAPSSNPSADRTITLPDLSGNITLTNGITMVDTWRLITQYINDQGTLGGTADWERDDTYRNDRDWET